MTSGPMITGIPSLGPGAKRVITWGQYGGLLKGIGDDIINVEINYETKRSILFGHKHKKTVCPVDIRSFTGTDASNQNWDRNLFEEVKKISEVLKSAASGQRPITIQLIDPDNQ